MSARQTIRGAPPRMAESWLFRITTLIACHGGMALGLPYETLGRDGDDFLSTKDPKFYAYLGVSIGLVLLGGAFAGLTIALMGQDEIYLQVIATSGDGAERRNSSKVLRLLKRGKHWVLVTLLVGNVITNETLPLVLDRCLGGGYAAAISSTVLVIVFGEIVPQSVCVRYGLPIGAWMSPFVLALMWIFSPITWPIAKLLDRILGEDHGTVYKKAGLKTLVTLHQTMGTTPNERLNDDEVSIIKGVLDLKAKSVGSIMTPMNDVFTLSADAILDEDMMHIIMREGYSRIPIHEPTNKGDFVGMLLVKILITYDPEDARKVCEFSLATLPETRPETSCLDIINFFQEGKSHMVLVSDFPGEPYGALGVVTLEDVIEELIGEEIIDESDVFIDVHKAIRRIQPAPTHKAWDIKAEPISESSTSEPRESNPISQHLSEHGEDVIEAAYGDAQSRISFAPTEQTHSSRPTHRRLRQRKSLQSNDLQRVRGYTPEIKQQLKHLGPSNAAKQPKPSRVNTVKIKNAAIKVADGLCHSSPPQQRNQLSRFVSWPSPVTNNNDPDMVGPGNSAKDGVRAIQANNGALDGFEARSGTDQSRSPIDGEVPKHESTIPSQEASWSQRKTDNLPAGYLQEQIREGVQDESPLKKSQYRAGMSEQFIDSGGVKKMVIQMAGPDRDADDTNDINDVSDAIIRGRAETETTRGTDSSIQCSRTIQSKSRRRRLKQGSDEADEQTPLITRSH